VQHFCGEVSFWSEWDNPMRALLEMDTSRELVRIRTQLHAALVKEARWDFRRDTLFHEPCAQRPPQKTRFWTPKWLLIGDRKEGSGLE